jgi:hypothetical protein
MFDLTKAAESRPLLSALGSTVPDVQMFQDDDIKHFNLTPD